MTDLLFQPFSLNGDIELKNKIVMAPLTRCMADNDLVPTSKMADYYARRADCGLIISEAILIRPDGQGYPNTPGLFTAQQIEGWRLVTEAVHQQGGKIFAQIWHTGRVAHPHFFDGDVIAPSAEKIEGTVPRMRTLAYVVPKAVSKEDISQLITDYAQTAENAIKAGFDGVEIHGANGYLIDQFLHYDANKRGDEYGGSAQNMARFPLAVVDAIIARIGHNKTALRISPGAYVNMKGDPRDTEVFKYLLEQLEAKNLAYLHVGIFDGSVVFDYLGGSATEFIRSHYSKTLMGVGCYTAQTGCDAIKNNEFDLLAIGRPFIANADYISKIKKGEKLTEYTDDMLTELI